MCRDIKAGRRNRPSTKRGDRRRGCARSGRHPDHRRRRSEQLLEEELGEDARITILGHVQRGGAPSAFDRYLGHPARPCRRRTTAHRWPACIPKLIGLRGHRVVTSPLMDCVARTQAVADAHQGAATSTAQCCCAAAASGSRYKILQTISAGGGRDPPRRLGDDFGIAVVHGGGPVTGDEHRRRAPRSDSASTAATPCSAVKNGFRGLRAGDVQEMRWMDVSGWVSDGGAEIGTNRYVPSGATSRRSPNRLPLTGSTVC